MLSDTRRSSHCPSAKPQFWRASVRTFGYWNVVPLAVGLTLFQVGEFAFVLARVGLSAGAIGNDVYAFTLNAAIVTMVLTPAVSGLTSVVYERFWPHRPREAFEAINPPRSGLSNHVLVAGWGRVGRSVGDLLSHLHLPYALVEFDDRRVRQARAAGVPVVYGDASQTVVLEAAGVSRARALLVTVPAYPDVRNIVTAARQVRADLPIVARADSADAIQALYALGVQEVASPEFEAGIEMTRQALIHLNVPASDILRVASGFVANGMACPSNGSMTSAPLLTARHRSDPSPRLHLVTLAHPQPVPRPYARRTADPFINRRVCGWRRPRRILDGQS